MVKIIKSFSIGLMLLTSVSFAQPVVDGFMKGKGSLDLVGGLAFEHFGQYFAADGLVKIDRTTMSFNIFGAIGITDWLDAQINIPYVMTKSPYSNFQDGALFLKWRLLNKKKEKSEWTAIISTGVTTPLSNYQTESLFSIGQQATALDARFIVQHKLYSGWFYMFQTGYTWRSDPTPSSLPFAFKFGFAEAKNYFEIYYDFQYAFGGSDYLDGTNRPFTTLGVSYHKLGGVYYRAFKEYIGMSFGLFGIPYGRNIGQAAGVTVALIGKIKYLKNKKTPKE